MNELFAMLLSKVEELKIENLARMSLTNDGYIRDNDQLYRAVSEEIPASEMFFNIKDKFSEVKKPVYLSFLVHRVLVSMKQAQRKEGDSHALVIVDSRDTARQLVTEHLYRVISQIQDAEFRITNKTPSIFPSNISIDYNPGEGYECATIKIPAFGKMTVFSFHNRGNCVAEKTIDHLLDTQLKGEKFTHLFKADKAFAKHSYIMRTFNSECKMLIEERMPIDSVFYTFMNSEAIHRGTYASTEGVRLSLQVNEENYSLIEELLIAMNKADAIYKFVDTDGHWIKDPIGTPMEALKLCKVERFEGILTEFDKEKQMMSMKGTGAIRGRGASGLWIDEDMLMPSGRQMDTLEEELRRSLTANIGTELIMPATMGVDFARQDSDGDNLNRNRRMYSEDTIRNDFFREWTNS